MTCFHTIQPTLRLAAPWSCHTAGTGMPAVLDRPLSGRTTE